MTHSACPIWTNGRGTCAIAGGAAERLNVDNSRVASGDAYLIDYGSIIGRSSHYPSFLWSR